MDFGLWFIMKWQEYYHFFKLRIRGCYITMFLSRYNISTNMVYLKWETSSHYLCTLLTENLLSWLGIFFIMTGYFFIHMKHTLSLWGKFNFLAEVLLFWGVIHFFWQEFYSCISRIFLETGNVFPWQEMYSCDRKFIPVTGNVFF